MAKPKERGISPAQLAQDLARGRIAPLYLVLGLEDALRERAVRSLEELVAAEDRELDLEKLDGRATGWGRAVAAARTLPWKAARRVVVVSGADRLSGDPEAVVQYAAEPSPRSVLVLEARAVGGPKREGEGPPEEKRKGPWKVLEARAVTVACEPLGDAALEREASELLRSFKVKASPEVVRRVVQLVGQDLALLQAEVGKLVLLAQDGTLRLEDVEALIGRSREHAIWDFTDALAQRDRDRALRVLGEMLEDGANENYLVAMAEWSFRNLLAGADLAARGRTPQEAAVAVGLRGLGATRLVDGLKRYKGAALRRTLRKLAALDRAVKSSRLPARVHLERFVLEVCGAAAPAGGRRPAAPGRGPQPG